MTGIETTVVTAIANGFIGQIIKSGWEGIIQNELLNKDVGQIVREGKYLFLKEYAERYWNRHGMIKVLKMSKPMNLESVYINVKCLDYLTRESYSDPENMEKSYRESNQRRFHNEENKKKDGLVFANQEQYLMVFGGPGIGKSTFLRKVGLEALKGNQGNYQHHLTPILLELKNFKETEINIQALIEEEFKICDFPNVEENISKKLGKGELLILLDGLDEVPAANVNNVIEKIQNFVDKHDKNRFILSCRTAARTRKPVGRRAIAYAYTYAYTNAYAYACANAYAYAYSITNVIANAIANANANANAIANANVNVNAIANAYTNTSVIAIANANAYINAITNAYANAMEELVKLSNLFAQDRIFSRVNIPQLNADLQALKQVIPGNKANRKERQDFIEQLFKTWNKAFFLTPKIADLSIEKIVNLSIEKKMQEIDKHYFYINHLILDCQKVAVNISPTVWQEIEDRMLRVP